MSARAPAPIGPGPSDGQAEVLLRWLNRRFGRPEGTIERDTPLFEDGLINSIRILEIIAWVERAAGRRIEDREVRMEDFRTVDRISEVFLRERNGGRAADGDERQVADAARATVRAGRVADAARAAARGRPEADDASR